MSVEFVIGIDSSTQSTKAIAWSHNGSALAEGRSAIQMSRPGEGLFEQEPADWWASCAEALLQLGRNLDMANAKAVAVSNQRETLGFLDNEYRSFRPAIVWLDERARPSVSEFSDSFGGDRLHRISGKPVDYTPVVYRLHWLSKHEPETLKRVSLFVDVHGHLTGRLSGQFTASWTSADPMGTFDISSMKWSEEILGSLGLRPLQFAPTVAPGSLIGHVSAAAAAETGVPQGIPVIAAGGDGQCAGLGVNAVKPGRAYLNLGTALVLGAWGATPRVSRDWRTMCSPTGDGYFYEGVWRAGTFLVDWFVENFVTDSPSTATFDSLEQAASALPIGCDGVIACPYLSGSMNPYWSMEASAGILGLRPDHGQAHTYRALLEALTGEVARTAAAMHQSGVELAEIIAVGGGARSVLWRQMIADATGLPVHASNSIEASSLGAAMSAAKGIGWFPDFQSAAQAMSSTGERCEPSIRNRSAWQELLRRQDQFNRFVVERAS